MAMPGSSEEEGRELLKGGSGKPSNENEGGILKEIGDSGGAVLWLLLHVDRMNPRKLESKDGSGLLVPWKL